MRVLIAVMFALLVSHQADARLGDRLGKRLDKLQAEVGYHPPQGVSHAVESSKGNLRQPVFGTLICLEYWPSDRSSKGLVFHSSGRVIWFPVEYPFARQNDKDFPNNFRVHAASEGSTGPVQGQVLPEFDAFRECPDGWDWSKNALLYTAIPEYRSDAQLAAERKAAEDAKREAAEKQRQQQLSNGVIVDGPNNSEKWVTKAKEVSAELIAAYPVFDKLWPAYEVFLDRIRNPNIVPTPSGSPFETICENKFDADNKKKKALYTANFAFDTCGDPGDNWAKLLAWYHPGLKDWGAAKDWSDFGYYREPQKLLFTEPERLYFYPADGRQTNCSIRGNQSQNRPVTLTTGKAWLLEGCLSGSMGVRSWRLRDPVISESYHWLFDLAERFNMRVAAIVTGDTNKYAPKSSLDKTVENISTQIRRVLFDSVRSEDDIRERISSFGLYPELLELYISLAGDDELITDEIEAYRDLLEEAHVDTPQEKAYQSFYDLVAVAQACYDYGKGRMLVYLDSNQWSEIARVWDNKKRQSGLTRQERESIETLTKSDPGYKNLEVLIKTNEWNSTTSDICRRMYRDILASEI